LSPNFLRVKKDFSVKLDFVSHASTMQRSLEQKIAIKFSVKLGKSTVETFPMIKTAFGDDCLSERPVYRWHKARNKKANCRVGHLGTPLPQEGQAEQVKG
jgi:hypothetical protein